MSIAMSMIVTAAVRTPIISFVFIFYLLFHASLSLSDELRISIAVSMILTVAERILTTIFIFI